MFKRFLIGAGVVFFIAIGWQVGDKLSPDALGMAVGLVFGVMATIPAALLVLAATHRPDQPHISHRAPPQISTEQRALMEAAYWRGQADAMRQQQPTDTAYLTRGK